MFKGFIKSLSKIFISENSEETTVKKYPQLEYTLIENSGWKVIDELPDTFNQEKELFLVRYHNNPTQVFSIKYDAKTKTIFNNWDEVIKPNRIAVFMVLSLDDKKWLSGDISHKDYYFDFEKNNILVDLNSKFFHANFLNTGNRYGITLCFYNGFDRITSKPKRWFNIPKAFLEV